MTSDPLFCVALALAAGMVARVVAERLHAPPLVVLLATGIALGPDGLGLVVPDALGGAAEKLVAVAVTVILFEGGLGLHPAELRAQRRPLLGLATVRATVSLVVGTVAARTFLGLSWQVAALYGSLMIVTGPTAVTPMLRRLRLDRTVRELLIGEGVLVDPLGAMVALVVAEWVVGRAATAEAPFLVVARLGPARSSAPPWAAHWRLRSCGAGSPATYGTRPCSRGRSSRPCGRAASRPRPASWPPW